MLNRRNLARLGLEIRCFTPEAFTDFLGDDVGRTLYEAASDSARARGLKPEELRVQISLRPDLFNSLQFLTSGPHTLQPPSMRSPSGKSYLCQIYPERSTNPQTGSWAEISRPFGGDQFHKHLIDTEDSGQ